MKVALNREAEFVVDALTDQANDVRMPGMVRHPDGLIYIQTRKHGLFRSAHEGRTWTRLPVELPDAPLDQQLLGIGVTYDGRLWLIHQSRPEELLISPSSDHARHTFSWHGRTEVLAGPAERAAYPEPERGRLRKIRFYRSNAELYPFSLEAEGR